MRLDRSELSKAVQTALSLGAVAAVGVAGTAFAQNANTTQSDQKNPQTLQTIVVTGSHIRRVDLETANPVVTVTRQQIAQSGAVTLGDLVQNLPAVTGSPQNTRVNNGGGTGGTFANLRGMGTGRTLVLVDGHRVLDNDLNTIPAEMVERIEVLTDGGAVTYGTDAIGGVVNFILRKNYQGAEATLNYGITDRDDGERNGASFIFGQTTDKGSILAGVGYNKTNAISSADRDWSKTALYQYSLAPHATGSSRTPTGYIDLTSSDVNGTDAFAPGYAGTGNCDAATRASGDGSAIGDYKCYSGSDAYNFQLLNYDLTPQERTNAFFRGDYQLTDHVRAYMDVFHTKTVSQAALAPLPFDANTDGVTISQYSMYNPFGVDFGPPKDNANVQKWNKDAAGKPIVGDPALDAQGNPIFSQTQYEMRTRWTGIGQRIGHNSRTTDQGIIGLGGAIGDTSWQWDAHYNYGHISQISETLGNMLYTQQFKNSLGPSALVNGVPTCLTAPLSQGGTAIDGCTPINIFNQADPAQIALEKEYVATFFSNTINTSRAYGIGANGTLFSLPAGDVQLAVGADYRKLYSHTIVSFLTKIVTDPNSPAFGTCSAPQSACTSELQGGYNAKDAYAEMYIPVLKDMPFVRSLNVTLGDRYSKYSLAGSTNNVKIGVEWRPIDDLLLRGTVQDVYRAPTIGSLYGAPTGNAPPYKDPCLALDGATLAQHPNACAGVPPNSTVQSLQGGIAQTTGVVSGSVFAGVNLKPEHGKSFDWGVVYDPHFLPGFSISADLWRIYLNDTITTLAAQTAANVCFSSDSSPLCNLLHRFPNGAIHFINQPTVNLGRLDTSGVDLTTTYRIPQVSWLPGQFTLVLNGTYLTEYTQNAVPGDPASQVSHVAGHYYNGFGSYPRVRGQLMVNWNEGPWDASWRVQYIGRETIASDNPSENQSADLTLPFETLPVPSNTTSYVQLGYSIQPINTKVSIGVDNVFDRMPSPVFTQTSVVNGNTDVNTYDTIGRFYWVRATVKF